MPRVQFFARELCVCRQISRVQCRLDVFVFIMLVFNCGIGGRQSRERVWCLYSVDIYMTAFRCPNQSTVVCFQLQFSNRPCKESAYKAVLKVFQRCNILLGAYCLLIGVSFMFPFGFTRCKYRVLCAFCSQTIALWMRALYRHFLSIRSVCR